MPLPSFEAKHIEVSGEGDSMLPNIRPNEWVLGHAVGHISEASDSKIYIGDEGLGSCQKTGENFRAVA